MGLTLHYDLQADIASPLMARSLLEKLQRRASELPFQKVLPVEVFSLDYLDREKHAPTRWFDAVRYIERRKHYHSVTPLRGFAFQINVGLGSEWASFGLAEYPKTIILPNGRRARTGLSGWTWHGFCKTQYASNPRYGGFENFRRCHVSLVELLDSAAELGFQTDIGDESDYATHRDLDELRRQIDTWNQLIAGFVGKLRDVLPGESSAPITDYPNFEHLEADAQEVEEEEYE